MESHNPFMFQTTNQIFYDYPMKNEGFMVVSWYANRKSMAQKPSGVIKRGRKILDRFSQGMIQRMCHSTTEIRQDFGAPPVIKVNVG